MSIGERAALAIEAMAKKNGTTIEEECHNIGATRKAKHDWERHGRNPQAYFLQQMALAGYDVIWILTGGSNGCK